MKTAWFDMNGHRHQLSCLVSRVLVLMVTLASGQISANLIAPEYPETMPWYIQNTGAPVPFRAQETVRGEYSARAGVDLGITGDAIMARGQFQQGLSILVAVLDTGIDVGALPSDFQKRIYNNSKECEQLEKTAACVRERPDPKTCENEYFDLSASGVDPDGNGYPNDCQGWSTAVAPRDASRYANPISMITTKMGQKISLYGNPLANSNFCHGTHVASEILRVSPHAKVLPVRVLPSDSGFGLQHSADSGALVKSGSQIAAGSFGDQTARGIDYAVATGARVINMSLSWSEIMNGTLLASAIRRAAQKGVLLVASSGNDGLSLPTYPCSLPEVICVGSIDPDGSSSFFSNYGSRVEISAPGRAIVGHCSDGQDLRMSGVSQAAALTSGVLAELLARGLSSAEAKSRLISARQPLMEALPVMVGGLQSRSSKSILSESMVGMLEAPSGRVSLSQALASKPRSIVRLLTKTPQFVPVNDETVLSFEFENLWVSRTAMPTPQVRRVFDFSAEASSANDAGNEFDPRRWRVFWSSKGAWPAQQTRSLHVVVPSLSTSMPRNLALEVVVAQEVFFLEIHPYVDILGAKTQALRNSEQTPDQSDGSVEVSSEVAAKLGLHGSTIKDSTLYEIADSDGEFLLMSPLSKTKDPDGDTGFSLVRWADRSKGMRQVVSSFRANLSGLTRDEVVFARRVTGADSGYMIGIYRSGDALKFEVHRLDKVGRHLGVESWGGTHAPASQSVAWMQYHRQMVPIWLGLGYSSSLAETLRPIERPGLFLYTHLDLAARELQSLEALAPQGLRFCRLLPQSISQLQRGVVPLLLCRIYGGDLKSADQWTYGEITQGQLHFGVSSEVDNLATNPIFDRVTPIVDLSDPTRYAGYTFSKEQGSTAWAGNDLLLEASSPFTTATWKAFEAKPFDRLEGVILGLPMAYQWGAEIGHFFLGFNRIQSNFAGISVARFVGEYSFLPGMVANRNLGSTLIRVARGKFLPAVFDNEDKMRSQLTWRFWFLRETPGLSLHEVGGLSFQSRDQCASTLLPTWHSAQGVFQLNFLCLPKPINRLQGPSSPGDSSEASFRLIQQALVQ